MHSSLDLDNHIGSQIMSERTSRRSGISHIVETTNAVLTALKIYRRGFALRGRNAQTAVGQTKKIIVADRNKANIAQRMNQRKIDPVFVKRVRIAIGQIKRTTRTGRERAVEIADKRESHLVTHIEMNGYRVIASRRWQREQTQAAIHVYFQAMPQIGMCDGSGRAETDALSLQREGD